MSVIEAIRLGHQQEQDHGLLAHHRFAVAPTHARGHADGFRRIRHYGLLANGSRKTNLNLAREFLNAPAVAAMPADGGALTIPPPTFVCSHCGCAMLILQIFTRGHGPAIRAPPSGQTR